MGYLFSVLQHANEFLVIKVTMVVNRRALEHNIHLIHACQLTCVCVCVCVIEPGLYIWN